MATKNWKKTAVEEAQHRGEAAIKRINRKRTRRKAAVQLRQIATDPDVADYSLFDRSPMDSWIPCWWDQAASYRPVARFLLSRVGRPWSEVSRQVHSKCRVHPVVRAKMLHSLTEIEREGETRVYHGGYWALFVDNNGMLQSEFCGGSGFEACGHYP